MELLLTRRYNAINTIGILRDDNGNELCVIGELPLSVMINGKQVYNAPIRCCIPEGIYHIRKHTSPKFGKCFAFDNKETKPRADILIHSGNYFADPTKYKSDSHGCLICGSRVADINGDKILDVADSKATLKRLLAQLPESFTLKIISD